MLQKIKSCFVSRNIFLNIHNSNACTAVPSMALSVLISWFTFKEVTVSDAFPKDCGTALFELPPYAYGTCGSK